MSKMGKVPLPEGREVPPPPEPNIMQKVKAASRAAAERAEAHPETASRDLEYERHPERCS